MPKGVTVKAFERCHAFGSIHGYCCAACSVPGECLTQNFEGQFDMVGRMEYMFPEVVLTNALSPILL